MEKCRIDIKNNQNSKILEFNCLFNSLNIFETQKYFLSKSAIDYLRYLIMFNSDKIYQYILNFYNKTTVCTTPYIYTIPIIKKNPTDNLGTVDYTQIKFYLIKNFTKVIKYRRDQITITENKLQITTFDSQLSNIKQQIQILDSNKQLQNIDTSIIQIKSQINSLPNIRILPNGNYQISGSQSMINKFNQLFNQFTKLNNQKNELIEKRNILIEKHNTLLEKRNSLVNINNTLNKNPKNKLIEAIIPNSYLIPEAYIKNLTQEQIIETFIDFEKTNIINKIKECQSNTMIILINLEFFIFKSGEPIKQDTGHANSLIIRKKSNTILAVRTEPHRHSNIYCRNSVRKAIRDIFSNIKTIIPNTSFTYLDYIMTTHIGLQSSESVEELEDSDYDSLPQNLKYISPLKGNSGFCSSWTLYISLLILLNPSLDLENIGDYLEYLNQPIRIKSVDEILEEAKYKSKTKIVSDLNKLVNKKGYIDLSKSHQDDPIYIITKHQKLYQMILTSTYILRRIENNNTIIFDDYIKEKLGNKYIVSYVRNIKEDNKIINSIMNTINKNYPGFSNNISGTNINLNTRDLFDEHKIEDDKLLQENACNDSDIRKHLKEIQNENSERFSKIRKFLPNISGYLTRDT